MITNAEPAIYCIRETVPPSEYDGNNTPQYIVMTGGLNIGTVKIGNDVVTTRDTTSGNQGVTVTFTNEKQVGLTVTKQIAKSGMNITGEHSFTFTLYDKDKKELESQTIKVNGTASGSESFTKKLSQGQTYYLKETDTETGFVLTGMTGSIAEITKDEDGYYKFTVPNTTGKEPSDITVTATNTYLYGQVSFMKVDGETGKALSGAKFRIVRVEEQQEVEVVSKDNIVDNNDGSYTATIPFDSTDKQTFRIYEVTEPTNYLFSDEKIEFELSPGEVLTEPILPENWSSSEYATGDNTEANNTAMLGDRIFPNYKGAYIDLTKYDNVHAAADTANGLSGAQFILYKQVDAENNTWERVQDKTTGTDGSLRFVVDGGVYALEETVPNGYQGLEGIYKEDSDVAEGTFTANVQTAAGTPEQKVLHKINGGAAVTEGTAYTYNAYNIPYIPLTIRKYNSDESSDTRLTATANVYEVPADVVTGWGDITAVTDDKIMDFLASPGLKPLIENIDVSKSGGTNGRPYSYADSTTENALGETLVAGKTYLVVENTAGIVNDTDGGTQIRGNEQVQWYDIVQPDKGTKDGQTADLYNVEGKASLALDKTVDNNDYTSLFTEAAEVEYILTPTVGNTYPLMDFTVNDTGLTAYGEKGSLFDEYLKDKYSLTKVKLGPASHDVSDYSDLPTAPINVTVTFKNSNGAVIDTQTVENLGSDGATVTLKPNVGKAAQVSISYTSPTFANATKKDGVRGGKGYALGANFNPGTIKITAEIEKQEGGAGKEAITKINNAAESTLSYYAWNPDGTEASTLTTVPANDNIDINFAGQKAPTIAVDKTSNEEDGTATLNSTTTYSIKITNQSTDGAVLSNPFIVDYLPQGTSWVLDSNSKVDVEVKKADTEEQTALTLGDVVTQTAGGEKAVLIYLNGELGAGKSVTVDLKVKIDNMVTAYGTTMYNYALVGSTDKGAQSTDNPYAASFKNSTGNWAEGVDTLLGNALSSDRLNALKEMLGNEAGDGFIMDTENLNWTTASESVLVKSAYGDRNANQGYTTNVLSTVNNIIQGEDSSGMMHYRLAVSNTSSDYKTTNLSVIDILPNVGDYTQKGDPRQSAWGLTYNQMGSVSVNGDDIGAGHYKVYYYTGILSGEQQYTDLYNDVLEIAFDTKENELPSGWTSTLPTDNMQSIKAFIVTTDATVQLDNTDSLYIEYTARVNDGKTPWTEEQLSNNSWKNAVNNFACAYSQLENQNTRAANEPVPLGKILESNEVSATTMPNQVKVGGHIWIDKNGDGIRQTGEDISSFAGHPLIEDMLSHTSVSLNTYLGKVPSGSSTSYSGSLTTAGANYTFDNLDPAMVRDNRTEDQVYPNGILDPAALKGDSPSTYTIDVDIDNFVKGIFGVTKKGEFCGESNHPDELIDAEKTDNNFTAANTGNTKAISSTSEQFYLWATDINKTWDNTKDFGVIPYRTLTITKQVADKNQNEVDGAKFTVYGPFSETGDITAESLTEKNNLGTYETTNGKVTIDNLLWYQRYVIVEESTAAGYTLDGAAASGQTTCGAGFTSLSGVTVEVDGKDKAVPAWILGIPATDKNTGANVNTAEDSVTIRNKKVPVEASLEASKTLTGKDLKANDYTFCLWGENGVDVGNPLQTKQNDADGKVAFDAISYDSEGEYTYYITEALPEGATEENKYTVGGITYDTTIYEATVDVDWEEGTGLKVNSVTYEKVVDKGQDAGDTGQGEGTTGAENTTPPTFTNTYSVTPTDYTPQVKKTFSDDSVDRPTAKDFTFTLTADEENPAGGAFTGVTDGAVGTELTVNNTLTAIAHGEETVDFSTITFKKAGTYKFQIQETPGADLGYTYDDAVWTLTVPVVDKGGELTIEGVTYQRNNNTIDKADDAAVFENTYAYVASIQINKEVVRGDAEYDTDDTFYAGIFRKVDSAGDAVGGQGDDAQGTGGEAENISYELVKDVVVGGQTVESGVVRLANNDSVEVFVPLGGEDQTDAVTYYVFETDTDGHPLVSFDADGNVVYNQPSVYEISSESRGEDGRVNSQGAVYVTAELAVGGKYYLHEARAPEGYVQAADIPFTVEDGEPVTLIMEDALQAEVLGQIQVTKRLSSIDETTFESTDLVAEDAVFYVGLFTDAQGEHPYGDDHIREIHVRNASSATVTYDDLPAGTYYVFETRQDGSVIPYGEMQNADAAGSSTFICSGDGSDGGVRTITLDLDDGRTEGSTELNNTYYGGLPDGFSYQGEISITYYIYETDANGNKVDKNAFAYSVSGEGAVALNADSTTGSRTIVNTMSSDSGSTRMIRPTDETDRQKSRDKNKTENAVGTDRRTRSTKTGDDNRIGLYILFFGAAIVGVAVSLRKRKKYNE